MWTSLECGVDKHMTVTFDGTTYQMDKCQPDHRRRNALCCPAGGNVI